MYLVKVIMEVHLPPRRHILLEVGVVLEQLVIMLALVLLVMEVQDLMQ